LNKGELIETLAEANEMSVSQSRRYLESMLELIEKKIKKGEEVNITGFGKFEVVKRAGRKGRNPATGESIKVPARKVPKFVAGASLKRSISGK
jgi:DNA-binding protein HU-beta